MENILILLAAIFGAVGAYVISINLNKGAVIGSAIITLISGIIFPRLIPEIGSTLAVVAAAGSYAGMISKQNVSELWEMTFVGAVVGIVFILSASTYIGLGGRLGTIAAISCFVWLGAKKLYRESIAPVLLNKTSPYASKSTLR